MTENNPKILTRDAVDSAPELTMQDVATDEEKAIINARKILSDAVEKTKTDAGAALEPNVIEAAALIYHRSLAEWARYRKDFKEQGASLRELDNALRKATIKIIKAGVSAARNIYPVINGALHFEKYNAQQGSMLIKLANFDAQIRCEQVHDDGTGEELERAFQIIGQLETGEALPPISVSSEIYSSMMWVVQSWGPRTVVCAGNAIKDHLRAAIQLRSGNVPMRVVLTHLGWHKYAENWGYVNANGVIGPVGTVLSQYGPEDIRLPRSLQRFQLPEPPTGEILYSAIKASLSFLELAPDEVTFPLYAGIFRAPLGPADFSIFIAGPTGQGKSELCALAQQHYGSDLIRLNLPASWSSTANSLEILAFTAKDSLLVVDDFCPAGSLADIQRFHRDADRLLRGQGNNSGRARSTFDAKMRAAKYPRGLILSTGEDIPKGQSLRGRMFILELNPGALDFTRLSIAQKQAADGIFSQAFSAYIQWLTTRLDNLRSSLPLRVAELRSLATKEIQHRRTPDIQASLAMGLQVFLEFAADVGAITPNEKEAIWDRGWAALGNVSDVQQVYQTSAEPTQRFLSLLRASISSGSAHIANASGDPPERPEIFGWRRATRGDGENEHAEWRPQGKLIGWIDREDLYLEPDTSYTVAQEFSRSTGEGLTIESQTLRKRLNQKGFLKTVDKKRDRLTVRRTLGGSRQDVLHLRTVDLIEPAQPTQSVHCDEDTEEGLV